MRLLPKAIAATLGVQAIIVMASLVVPLTAAGVAPRLGLEPHLVGYYASLTFLAAAFASLATPQWVRRYGAIRVHQIMLLVAVAGLAVLRPKRSLDSLSARCCWGSPTVPPILPVPPCSRATRRRTPEPGCLR